MRRFATCPEHRHRIGLRVIPQGHLRAIGTCTVLIAAEATTVANITEWSHLVLGAIIFHSGASKIAQFWA